MRSHASNVKVRKVRSSSTSFQKNDARSSNNAICHRCNGDGFDGNCPVCGGSGFTAAGARLRRVGKVNERLDQEASRLAAQVRAGLERLATLHKGLNKARTVSLGWRSRIAQAAEALEREFGEVVYLSGSARRDKLSSLCEKVSAYIREAEKTVENIAEAGVRPSCARTHTFGRGTLFTQQPDALPPEVIARLRFGIEDELIVAAISTLKARTRHLIAWLPRVPDQIVWHSIEVCDLVFRGKAYSARFIHDKLLELTHPVSGQRIRSDRAFPLPQPPAPKRKRRGHSTNKGTPVGAAKKQVRKSSKRAASRNKSHSGPAVDSEAPRYIDSVAGGGGRSVGYAYDEDGSRGRYVFREYGTGQFGSYPSHDDYD